MDSLVESMGLLCLAIQEGRENDVGRTKLQKMIYFADRYLGWDVGDYRLHYYGPFSQNVASTIQTVRGELINETEPEFGPYQYKLTEEGSVFLEDFVDTVCDEQKTAKTRNLFSELSQWSKDELELAATLDYVNKNTPGITKENLIAKVGIIKENFTRDAIEHAYELWSTWKREHNL